MALDKEYFDSINIEIAKKKYYNANKVENVLADIREQAFAMIEENKNLRAQLAELKKFKCDISDTLLSAKTISQTMIEDAKNESDDIISKAEQKAAQIIEEAEKKSAEMEERNRLAEQKATENVEAAIERIRQMHMNSMMELDEVLQDYLDGMVPDDNETVPEDLSDKVGAIASELFSIGEE